MHSGDKSELYTYLNDTWQDLSWYYQNIHNKLDRSRLHPFSNDRDQLAFRQLGEKSGLVVDTLIPDQWLAMALV